MNEKALRILEYPKIIDRLTEYAGSPMGRDKCRALLPTDDLALILKNNRPVLAIGGTPQAAANRLFALIESFNRTKPLAGHITDILIMETPLPRTATGKIKHWEITDARR